MRTLLTVTADAGLYARLQHEAERTEWVVRSAHSRVETMRGLYYWDPDALVLDTDPQACGQAWIIYDQVREVCDVPILVLTAGATNEQSVAALTRGADDAVARSALAAEIFMRARNMVRSSEQVGDDPPSSRRCGNLVFKPDLRQVSRDDHVANLTATETQILQRFLDEPDRFLTAGELAAAVWENPLPGQERAIKVYVHRLRRKLMTCDPDGQYIANHRTIGYRFANSGEMAYDSERGLRTTASHVIQRSVGARGALSRVERMAGPGGLRVGQS
jgi:DNA-binding response OmpR family regulator